VRSRGERRDDAHACFAAAIAAVEPGALVARHLAREGDALVLRARDGGVAGTHAGPVVVLGAGKAAVAMARAVAAAAGAACRGGIVVAPHGADGAVPGVVVAYGAHPVPDAAGATATARVLDAASSATADMLVVVVLSGGASALLVSPADGITLADKQAVTSALLAAGTDVASFNCIRKHCSRVKGGGLLRAAASAAAVWTLLLSDVVGDDPATIASGPTTADPTTFADAAAALARSVPRDAVPASIATRLARGIAGLEAETPKPGDAVLATARTVVVGSNRDAVEAAAREAAARGYDVDVVAEPLTGDAAAAAAQIVARLAARPRDRRVAVVAGGETTVRAVPGGRGGRCQHLALAAATRLAGLPVALLAAGTDGVDGPSGAAGACADGETVARARAAALDPARALATTDSATLLAATGDLVVTGPTGTNVADLVVALRDAC
jgi:glycerate 2-kinase